MITRDNLQDVLGMLDDKQRARLWKAFHAWDYEFVVLYLHTFNAGSYVEMRLTNNWDRYRNVSNNGNCILDITDVIYSLPAKT